MNEIDCTPPVSYLNSVAVQKMPWHNAIAEIVDNSLDAGATIVEISIDSKSLTVKDNGEGCTDVSSMVTLGDHRPGKKTRLGQYGVGLKDAWISRPTRGKNHHIYIETVSHGRKTILDHNTANIGNDWKAPGPKHEDTTEENGTLVCIKNIVTTKCLDENYKSICLTFTPALEEGKQISWKWKTKPKRLCKAVKLPILSSVVEDTFSIGGKDVSICIGITPEGHVKPYLGFRVYYEHRTIMTKSIGCGGFSASRLDGYIQLGQGWRLGKHKDSVHTNLELLEDEVQRRIQHLLEQSDQLSNTLELKRVAAELERNINTTLKGGRIKEKRSSPQNDTGVVAPKDTDRKRSRAEKVDPTENGSVINLSEALGKRRGLSIVFDGREGFGEVEQINKRVVIHFNLKHPVVFHAKSYLPLLHTIAVGLLADHACRGDGQLLLSREFDTFQIAWSALAEDIELENKLPEACHA